MINRWIGLIGLLGLACTHAQTVEDPSRVGSSPSEAEAPAESDQAKGEEAKGETAEAPGQGAASSQSPPKSRGLVAGGAKNPSEVPVSTSSQGLLQPGAEQKVRDKLGLKSGASLREAVEKFQRENDLPATGVLDQRTAEEIGLDPDELFVRATGE